MFLNVRLAPPILVNSIEKGEWQTGLFEITDPCFLCTATFFPCVAYGLNYSLMINDESNRSCVPPCLCFGLTEAISVLLAVLQITNTTKYNDRDIIDFCLLYQQQAALDKYIKKTAYPDCSLVCKVCFCAPCAQAQLRSELQLRRKLNPRLQFKPLHSQCCCKDYGWAGCVEL